MKCEENGECPFVVYRTYSLGGDKTKTDLYCKRDEFECECRYELQYKRCHLTPADFPIIRAMIAGEAIHYETGT